MQIPPMSVSSEALFLCLRIPFNDEPISYNHKVSHIAQLLIFSVTAMIPLLAVLTWVVFRLNGLSKRRILLNSWGRNMYGFHKDMVTIQSTMEPKEEGEPLRPLRGHLP